MVVSSHAALIANALAPLHSLAEAISVSSNYHAALVLLFDDAAPTFNVARRRLPLLVDAWASWTDFNSELSLSGRADGDHDRADQGGKGREHRQSLHGKLLGSTITLVLKTNGCQACVKV
jgi:hypothetical protein